MRRTAKPAEIKHKTLPRALPGAVSPLYTRCGKANCRCTRGARHGPYYRRQWYEGGRLRSAYVRKRDVAQVRQACAVYAQQRYDERAMMREALEYSRLGFRELRALLREVEGWER